MKPLVTRGFALLLVVMVLPLGCAKRPVIYRDPSFNRKAVKGRAAAFLLPDSIDIAPVVQEFVTAFDGDPTEIHMTSQCFVWSRGTMALVWSGFVNGWTSGVNERGLRQLANSFAYDLWAVME